MSLERWLDERVRSGARVFAGTLREAEYGEVRDLECGDVDGIVETLRAVGMKGPTERKLRNALGELRARRTVVRLNVGNDVVCDALRSTLEHCEFFRSLLADPPMDKDGNVFVDRDGRAFRYVLSQLRGNLRFSTIEKLDARTRLDIIDDALFYGVPGLVERVVIPPLGARVCYLAQRGTCWMPHTFGVVTDFDSVRWQWTIQTTPGRVDVFASHFDDDEAHFLPGALQRHHLCLATRRELVVPATGDKVRFLWRFEWDHPSGFSWHHAYLDDRHKRDAELLAENENDNHEEEQQQQRIRLDDKN